MYLLEHPVVVCQKRADMGVITHRHAVPAEMSVCMVGAAVPEQVGF